MDAAACIAHRQENALPVLTAIKKYIDSLTIPVVLPTSDLAVALYSKLVPDAWKRDNPQAVQVYREGKSRYKSDRKQIDRARRIVAAKQKRPQPS